MPHLPTGTVAFLFTDLEGSTQLWERDPTTMGAAVARHDGILREAIVRHGGTVFKTGGDGLCAVFERAPDALAAALEAQLALGSESWGQIGPLRARMAVHVGTAEARGGDYFGPALNRVARLLAIAHGGQTLLSQTARDLTHHALADGVALRDLGAHRLKDLQQPEHVFQMVHEGLPDEFAPLRSLEALPHNLPLQPTSFIGREQELADLRRLLPATRLLTLTGPGGSGKTRLGLQLAAEVVESYPEGVWLVDLAAVSDPAVVVPTVAAALAVREVPGRPFMQTLTDALGSRRLLILLDNCEHVVEACAQLAAALLRACPDVTLLATSREALGTGGEVVWPVPSLSAPDPRRSSPGAAAGLAESEAARLFVDRARMVKPAFAVTGANGLAVAQICHRLDGIPLAIELAAGRVKALSPEQIAARLDDRFRLLTGGSRTALPRHQTLRATIDWSYELLPDAERTLLRRLSVFSGGWILEAAEAVCGADGLESEDVLDLQGRLIDKSLVTVETAPQGETRYRLLGTVRDYGAERLSAAGETGALRARHRDWFLALAERAAPELTRPDQAVWLDRLEQEHDNLRAALEWSQTEEGAGVAGLRLAAFLWRFWYARSHLTEGRRWLTAALQADSGGDAAARARALRGAGALASVQGDAAEVRRLVDESCALYRELDDPIGLARALMTRGNVELMLGNAAAAQEHLEAALAAARPTGVAQLMATVLNNLGEVARMQGDLPLARERYEEAVRENRRAGLAAGAVPLENLARVALHEGDPRRARLGFLESLQVIRKRGDLSSLANILEGMGEALAREARSVPAARLLGAANALREALNAPIQPADRPGHEAAVAEVRASLDEERFGAAWAEGERMTVDEAVELAMQEGGRDGGVARR